MKSRMSKSRVVMIGALLAATTIASAQTAPATMRVDVRAPIAATLLPEVLVTPDQAGMRIVATEALPVTLMPTVHVTARTNSLAVESSAPVTLPTIHVVARVPQASNDTSVAFASESAPASPIAGWAAKPVTTAVRALHIETMPR